MVSKERKLEKRRSESQWKSTTQKTRINLLMRSEIYPHDNLKFSSTTPITKPYKSLM